MERLKVENEVLRQHQGEPPPDWEALRDRILKSLKLGTQAPGYKASRKALDQFINELDRRGEG
ncbi:MAG TPA: hypothetical protein V6D48_02255 [Oculatellaceae cyanobacterium]